MPIKVAIKDNAFVVQALIDLAKELDALIGQGEGDWRVRVDEREDLSGNTYVMMRLDSITHPDLKISRVMYSKLADGRPAYINHEFFTLPPELQGKGLSDPVMRLTQKLMPEFGLKSAGVHANIDVGGYAWLRKGFMPNDPRAFLASIARKAEGGLGDMLLDEVGELTDDQLQDWFLGPQAQKYKPLFLGSDWFGQADLTDAKVRAALFRETVSQVLDQVHDATLHSVILERLKAAEVRDFNQLIPILERQVNDVLNQLKVTSLSELKRGELNAVLRHLQEAQQKALAGQTDKLMARLAMISEYEAEFEAATINRYAAAAGVTSTVTPATGAAAFALANAVPLSATGDLLGAWVKDMTAAEVAEINKVLLRAFSEGWTNDQVRQILSGTRKMKGADGLLSRMGKHNATIVRTSIQHVASTAREATWRANDDMIKKYQWVSTLDSRTSPQCRSLDGQTFEIGKGPRPPIHPNCRSTTIAVLPGKLGEMLRQGRTRASAGGPVSASMTYYEWLSQQPASFQEDVLGPSRYKLFKADGMTAEKFAKLQLNAAFQPLTLEELKAKGY